MTLRRIALLAALAATVSIMAASQGQASGGTAISTCGQTVTTNSYLTQSIDCGANNGIVVGASGLTIDLKGFTLRGDRSLHYGIYDSGGYDSVTVKNGVLRNFYSGAVAYGGGSDDQISLSNLVVSGGSGDGIVIGGVSATIRSTNVSGNVGNGISITGASARIQTTTAAANGLDGIFVGGTGARIQSSTGTGNGIYGIVVGGDSATIQSSIAVGNALHGIEVAGDAPVLNRNRTDANGFAGGASDGSGRGINTTGYTAPPTGRNVARGNDDPTECAPLTLC